MSESATFSSAELSCMELSNTSWSALWDPPKPIFISFKTSSIRTSFFKHATRWQGWNSAIRGLARGSPSLRCPRCPHLPCLHFGFDTPNIQGLCIAAKPSCAFNELHQPRRLQKYLGFQNVSNSQRYKLRWSHQVPRKPPYSMMTCTSLKDLLRKTTGCEMRRCRTV